MRPHEPGVASHEEDQDESREEETHGSGRRLHERDDGKQEADQQPEVLVQPPELEGDPAGCDRGLCTFHTRDVFFLPRISSCDVCPDCLHSSGTPFLLPIHAPSSAYATTS